MRGIIGCKGNIFVGINKVSDVIGCKVLDLSSTEVIQWTRSTDLWYAFTPVMKSMEE